MKFKEVYGLITKEEQLKIQEEMNNSEINALEKKLDTIFKSISVDVEFTRHFVDRVKDRDIEAEELISTFQKLYDKHKDKIVKDDFDGLIYDVSKYLNIPIHVSWHKKDKEYEMLAITVVKTQGKPKGLHQGDRLLKV